MLLFIVLVAHSGRFRDHLLPSFENQLSRFFVRYRHFFRIFSYFLVRVLIFYSNSTSINKKVSLISKHFLYCNFNVCSLNKSVVDWRYDLSWHEVLYLCSLTISQVDVCFFSVHCMECYFISKLFVECFLFFIQANWLIEEHL